MPETTAGAPAPRQESRLARNLERGLLFLGMALFVWLVVRLGWRTLLHDLDLVGWGFLAVLALEAVAIVVNTFAWRVVLPRDEPRVPLLPLVGMRLSGDAINYVTPSATIGGEFVKVRLLQRRISSTGALSSVSLSVLTQFFSQVLFVLCGVPFLLGRGVLRGDAGNAALALFGFLVFLVAGLTYLGWFGGGLVRVKRALDRMAWFRNRWGGSEENWRKLDEEIFGAFRRRPVSTALSILLHWLGWLAGAVEISLVLYWLGTPVGWETAVCIEALSVLIDTSLFFVPAKIGTQEGGKVAIFLLLGLSAPSGLAVGVVRRLKEILWALAGLLVLAQFERGRSRAGALNAATPSQAGPR